MKKPKNKENNSQEIDFKKIEGDAKATNVKIQNIENVENMYVADSDILKTKKFEEKDIEDWENEETLISINDKNMIESLIKNEEEIKEVVPIVKEYLVFFNLLIDVHKGHFINALQTIIRENKAKLKFQKIEFDKEIDEKENEELIKLFDELNNEDELHKAYTLPYYVDYKKIYNLMRSDDIKEFVIPKIKELEKRHKGEKLRDEFLVYWGKRLSYHPHSVFVSNQSSITLINEVSERLEDKENSFVRVYSRREENITKARLACIQVKKKRDISFKEEKDQIGFDRASTFIFNK